MRSFVKIERISTLFLSQSATLQGFTDVARKVRRYRDANTNSRRLHLPTVASELASDVMLASDVSSDATFNVVPDTSTSHTGVRCTLS